MLEKEGTENIRQPATRLQVLRKTEQTGVERWSRGKRNLSGRRHQNKSQKEPARSGLEGQRSRSKESQRGTFKEQSSSEKQQGVGAGDSMKARRHKCPW
jgi:hypothetical protein